MKWLPCGEPIAPGKMVLILLHASGQALEILQHAYLGGVNIHLLVKR